MMSARDNFAFINRVLGEAGPIIRKYSGFVDKYLGDAAMALFEDAADAVMAGIEVYQTLILNEDTRVTIGGDPINIGVGVHTGPVMLVSRDTVNHFGGRTAEFERRFIGMVQPAGVNEVVGVFDVLDALDAETRRRRLATREVFESGIRMFHTRDYQTAAERFRQVAAEDPSDICAQNCLNETIERLENPGLPSIFTFARK